MEAADTRNLRRAPREAPETRAFKNKGGRVAKVIAQAANYGHILDIVLNNVPRQDKSHADTGSLKATEERISALTWTEPQSAYVIRHR